MAQVTIELRQVLAIQGLELFDFTYPVVDSNWKTELEAQFKDFFYFYEIGSETIDRFKHNLKRKMNEIMPYYNDLYNSRLMVIDPLITSKVTETYEGVNTGLVTTNNINTGNTFDYPQQTAGVPDLPTSGVSGEVTVTTDNNSGVDYTKIIEGMSGDPNALLKAYRQNIINVNQLIMKDCKDLFILVY